MFALTRMTELDAKLKQLAIEAQGYPAQSKERRLAIAKLVHAIQQSGKLCQFQNPAYSQEILEEVQALATQELFLHIHKKIDGFDPKYDVLQWSNFLLRKRFFPKAVYELMEVMPRHLNQKRLPISKLDEIEAEAYSDFSSPSNPSLIQEVVQYLDLDPEGLFKSQHIANCPEANFRFISLKLVAGYRWEEISQELGVPKSSLSSFYSRSLKKFAPKLREYLRQ